MMVSVVVKVRNEEHNIRDALDSLVVQEGPLEIIIVDGSSTDRTRDIVEEYRKRFGFIRLFKAGRNRAESLNYGLARAEGDIIALTDGDVIANPYWLTEMRRSIMYEGHDYVAGRSITIGLRAWEDLARVELYNQGFDCSWPGCNIAYRREVYEKVGDVDPWFITAEDIDYNIRVTDAGYQIHHNPDAIIYNRARNTVYGFINQAFWNGAGRKQLNMKYSGRLWHKYNPINMLRDRKMTFWYMVRIFFAGMGYIGYKYSGRSKAIQ